jgi:hypothetical protein
MATQAQILDNCENPNQCLTELLSAYQSNVSHYNELKGVVTSGDVTNTYYQTLLTDNALRVSTIQFLDYHINRMVRLDYERKETEDSAKISKYKSSDLSAARASELVGLGRAISDFLGLDQENTSADALRSSLSYVQNHYSLQLLYDWYRKNVVENVHPISPATIDRNLQLISEQLANIESERFMMYKSNSSEKKFLKSLNFYTDNDFFTLGNLNQDREYTGGGSIVLTTDYLAWRWLTTGWLQYIAKTPEDRIRKIQKAKPELMSYQSLGIGFHFYTPYIRYRNNYDLADSMHINDRPFGSFGYVERTKNRLWPSGLVRHQGSLKVGQVGTNAGRDIQGVLHQDVTLESQKVYGWDKQIAHGGRLAAQVNHRLDLLLFSNTNRYSTIFKPYTSFAINKVTDDSPWPQKLKTRYLGVNLYNRSEVEVGAFNTGFSTGFYLSGLDFTRQAEQGMIKERRNNVYRFGFNYEVGYKYSYVAHNSMLEGFGYFATAEDDPWDDEALTSYQLPSNVINRGVHRLEAKLSFRWREMIVYYNVSYNTKEYTLPLVDLTNAQLAAKVDAKAEDQRFFAEDVTREIKEYNDRTFYGYGRVGVVWLVR